jgi:hypothetical protein
MADDWIKVRVNLHSHPKVVRIVSAVCPQNVRDAIGQTAARCMVIGALHAAWCLFDMHSTDGRLDGYSPEDLDQVVGLAGFSNAMQRVGWLHITDNCLQMRDFDAHNGKGAKRRAEDTASKRVRRMSAECPQGERTDRGPEKRREEKREENPPYPPQAGDGGEKPKKPPKLIPAYSPAFEAFWARYPTTRRTNKPGAWKVWERDQLERPQQPGQPRLLDLVMRSLEQHRNCEQWQDGYVPLPTTWLNQKRWSTDPPTRERNP